MSVNPDSGFEGLEDRKCFLFGPALHSALPADVDCQLGFSHPQNLAEPRKSEEGPVDDGGGPAPTLSAYRGFPRPSSAGYLAVGSRVLVHAGLLLCCSSASCTHLLLVGL
ncbi:hypothetical protein EYF80_005995 [Liparis tanakae]|uniref:Uncharacterized protein n=1 Tax=Liparis tanakae TaxID=230148 RepID=A0A4Z2J0T1_9TELE|nr:hypothetical protein EYF80_005995 [Liparis tanakae]